MADNIGCVRLPEFFTAVQIIFSLSIWASLSWHLGYHAPHRHWHENQTGMSRA